MTARRQQLINKMLAHALAHRGQLTARDLSQQFDLSEPVVRHHCARVGAELKKQTRICNAEKLQRRVEVLRQHAADKSAEELAALVGVGIKQLYRILRAHDIDHHSARLRPEQTAAHVAFLRQHSHRLNVDTAALELEVPIRTVRNLCWRYQIKLQRRSRRQFTKDTPPIVTSERIVSAATPMDLLLRAPKMSQTFLR